MDTINYGAGEKKIKRIPLTEITISHNPRNPILGLSDHLVEEGFYVGEGDDRKPLTTMQLVHDYALSPDKEKQQKYVDLLEKYETGPKDLVSLANDRREVEIQSIMLRSYRVKNTGAIHEDDESQYLERFGIIIGERRYMAQAYNFAKFGEEYSKIGAVIQRISASDAYNLAVVENLKRKDADDIEYGFIFRGYKDQINSKTGKNFKLKDVADLLGIDYQYVATREALTYLPESDIKRVRKGTLGITAAITKGRALKRGNTPAEAPDKKEHRQRVMSYAEVQNLFDTSRNAGNDFLDALGRVMKISLEQAITESDARIKEAEQLELKAVEKFDDQSSEE